MIEETIAAVVLEFCPEKVYPEEWDWDGLGKALHELTGDDLGVTGPRDGRRRTRTSSPTSCRTRRSARYEAKEGEVGADNLRELERQVMLRVIDTRWMEHLLEMDYLKEGIGLRAIGQGDPLVEYKERGVRDVRGPRRRDQRGLPAHDHARPGRVGAGARADAVHADELHRAHGGQHLRGPRAGGRRRTRSAARRPTRWRRRRRWRAAASAPSRTVVKDKDDPYADVGRNDPCPCGSGKKYKKCHGANA